MIVIGCGCGGGRTTTSANGKRERKPVFRHRYPQAGGYATVDYHDESAALRAQAKLGGSVDKVNPTTGKPVA